MAFRPVLPIALSLSVFAFGEGQAAASMAVPPPWARDAVPPKRRALVIGVQTYVHARTLPTPNADASLVESVFDKDLEFVVRRVPADHTDWAPLVDEIAAFAATVEEGDVVVVYFSGHGLQRNNANYLVPSDAAVPDPGDEPVTLVPVDWVWRELADRSPGVIFLILDACRTDAFSLAQDPVAVGPPPPAITEVAAADALAGVTATVKALDPPPAPSGGDGLAAMPAPASQVLTAFAASPGYPAYSLFAADPEGSASIYTRALMARLKALNYPVDDIVGLTALEVYAATQAKQTPMLSKFGPLRLQFQPNEYLDGYETYLLSRTATEPDAASEVRKLEEFQRLYPASRYGRPVKQRIGDLRKAIGPTRIDYALAPTIALPDALKGIVLSGAVRSASGDSKGLALANRDIVVRASPNAFLTRRLARISPGDPLQVLQSRADGWAEVIAPNGAQGWIGKVSAAAVEAPSTISVGRFSPSADPALADIAWTTTPPDPAELRRSTSTVAIRVGEASNVNASLAAPLRAVRAERLREALLAQGIAAKQILIEPDAAGLETDTATLSVYNSGAGR